MPILFSPLGAYLRARRRLVCPEDVGLPRQTRRRVEGLRREEVARLAGISEDYYLRLEQGRDRQPSDQVLGSLGRALLLDAFGMDHIHRLARLPSRPDGVNARPKPTPAIQQGLRAMLDRARMPCFVLDVNQDIVMANSAARALAPGWLSTGSNLPLRVFSAEGRASLPNWELSAEQTVSALLFHSDPFDPRLHEVVGTLSLEDPDFRRLWARHDARPFLSGRTTFDSGALGVVSFEFQTLLIPGSSSVLCVFDAEPASRTALIMDRLLRDSSIVENVHQLLSQHHPAADVPAGVAARSLGG